MKDKLILFDWGNIVESHTTGFSCHDAWDDIFLKCGYKGSNNIYKNLAKYQLSSITNIKEYEKVYNQMVIKFNLKTSFNEYIKIYKEIFDKVDYYKNVSDYEKSLKDKCYIGILSNLSIFDKQRLDKQVNLSEYDYVFLSFELGCRKPDKEIYEKVSNVLPFEPKDILFIDDTEANIETAKKIGWNTLKATGLELDLIKKTCEEFLTKK